VTVSVRLFARARDLAGSDRVELHVGPEPTVGAVRSALLAQCPQLAPLGSHLLAAMNSTYADDRDRVVSGAEIAFFPPVSGG
jgi:sulfur-carrier protein